LWISCLLATDVFAFHFPQTAGKAEQIEMTVKQGEHGLEIQLSHISPVSDI